MSKPTDCPLRIQRMLIRLQKYDVKLTYTPGKYTYAVDRLSRAVDKHEKPDKEKCADIQVYVDMIMTSLPVSSERTEQIKQETEKDETLKELKRMIKQGWPEHKSDCLSTARLLDLQNRADGGRQHCVQGKQVCYPVFKGMLRKIHEGHLGEEKCKRRAREVMYWPRMNQDISQTTATLRSRPCKQRLARQSLCS